MNDISLESWLEPIQFPVPFRDSPSRFARGRSPGFRRANVKRIADQPPPACFESERCQPLGIARQQRRKGRVGFDAGCVQFPDGREPFVI